MQEYYVNPVKLREFTENLFQAAGCSPREGKAVAGLLVGADLRGVRSHGVIRIERYLEKMVCGGITKNAPIEIVKETPIIAVVDAKGAFGPVASDFAVELARKKAKECGIGFVTVRNSNHFGTAGHWALELAGEDMIGYCGSNTYPFMVGPGMTEPGLGNNPFAMAYSGGKYKEICIDMACSVVAGGKIMDLESRGLPVPMNWFLDKEGKPCNEFKKMGAILPFGGHKGFGVAQMIETFGTLLSSGPLTFEMNVQADPYTSENASQFFMAMDIEAFRPVAEFKSEVDRMIDYFKSRRKAEGVDEIKYFGEIEYTNKTRIAKEGVLLPETLTSKYVELAKKYGMPDDCVAFLTENPKA